MTKRVLICANPDLNYIDGSSIWSQTIALATAATGEAEVDFLAKSAPQRQELFGPLTKAENLTVLDGTAPEHWRGKRHSRLTLPMMAELAVHLDKKHPYDVIIVRGQAIATQLLDAPDVLAKCWMYLTDIPQVTDEYTPQARQTMKRLAQGCQRVLCQTQGFKELWNALVPGCDQRKFALYTPVIPDLPDNLLPLMQRPKRAVYAGKFTGDWKTLEKATVWPDVHDQVPDSELVMIGDKIHNEPQNPDYKKRMRKALETTRGLNWLGAQPRESVQQQLQQAWVGLSWRDESMNHTVEYSTKMLEYGGAGCAAIVNRNPLHEQLLGPDYPLFANSADEFKNQLMKAFEEPKIAQQAADTLRQLAERHTFTTRVGEIRQWLDEAPEATRSSDKTKVLVAGHDLKFFTLLQKKLEATGQFEFLIDQWQGHNKHDEAKSRLLLAQADVIFCEWCLGNLKWYSHNKKPGQRLIARFHAQEARVPYMGEAIWDNIDLISFVSEHTRRQALDTFKGFPFDKTTVIPNYLDETKFTPKKKTGDARFTLGMVGVAPKSKRLDRALDLLEALLEEDGRYCLRVKGKHPLDYDWLLKREDELKYYRNIFERINSSPSLRYKVIFDPPGDDVNNWFTMVGYVLSPSDHESFHMAIGEGILTGTTPIIWAWDGAGEIWGAKYVKKSVQEAKQAIISSKLTNNVSKKLTFAISPQDVLQSWQRLFRES
ncbi:glycosyltransferase [Marinobacter lacisalsi]|uniref:Glycosyltransferase n=1 Tax=Marinobacter lacisalsi TaxID=475979 RepID=A0ABV8QIH6_9GAMM